MVQQQQQTFKEKVRVFTMYVGTLACDNERFDRTCPKCGGWFDSAKTANCNKCGTQLTWLTAKNGKRMVVSEGTFYPILGSQRGKDEEQTLLRKGMLPTYRFKLFSFAGPNEPLVDPALHTHCRRGAVVKIAIVNHQPIYKKFVDKEGRERVESMLPVYAGFGDKVEIIQDAKEIASYEDSAPMDPKPEQNQNLEARLAALQQQYNELKAMLSAQNTEVTLPPIPTEAPDMSYAEAGTELDSDFLFDENAGQAQRDERIQEDLGPESAEPIIMPFPVE